MGTAFPPNTSNQNFDIAILFSVVDFQIENMFLGGHSPTTLGARVLSYALRAYKNDVGTMHCLLFFPLEQGTSYGRSRRRNFKRGSFDWKLRVLVEIDKMQMNVHCQFNIHIQIFSNQNFNII